MVQVCCFCLVYLSLTIQVTLAALVNEVTPVQGSLEGGTRVTIRGSGFTRSGLEGTTTVYIGNDICKIEEYYSNDETLVCYTPSRSFISQKSTESISVYVSSLDKTEFASSRNNQKFKFEFDSSDTPSITSMSRGGVMGSNLSFYGSILPESIDSFFIKVGEYYCDADEVLNPDAVQKWGDTVLCQVPDSPSGRFNMSIRMDHSYYGYGTPKYHSDTYQFDFIKDQPFQFTIHPYVTSLNTKIAGTNGMGLIKIHGYGFGDDIGSVSVQLGGINCVIIKSSRNEIQCETSSQIIEQSSVKHLNYSLYEGGRGLLARRCKGSSYCSKDFYSSFLSNDGSSTYYTMNDFLGISSTNDHSYVSIEAVGYFAPTVSGNYTFYCMGDDSCEFSISPNMSHSHLKVVSSVSYVSSYYSYPSQISPLVELQANSKYFVKTRVIQYGGAMYYKVAMKIKPTNPIPSTLQSQYASVRERQLVKFKVDIVREVQKFTIYNNVNASITLFVTTSAGSNFNSKSLLTTASSSQWQAELTTIYSNVYCSSVSVTKVASSSNSEFTLTFNCPSRTNWPILQIQGLDSSKISTVTRVSSPSTPLGGSFRFKLQNESSISLTVSSSTSTITEAIYQLSLLIGSVGYKVTSNWESYSSSCLDTCTLEIYYHGVIGDVPTIEIDASMLTGVNASATVTVREEGSLDLWINPIPMDYFELAIPYPTVKVWSNGFLATCNAHEAGNSSASGCTFVYDSSVTPQVSSIEKNGVAATGSTVSLLSGDSLKIIGTGFLTFIDGNTEVWIGPSLCNVTSISSTEITCIISPTTAGTYPLRVIAGAGRGLATVAVTVPQLVYALLTTSITPALGSVIGGHVVDIVGDGFSASTTGNAITVGGNVCNVISASYQKICCEIPQASNTAGNSDVAVVVNGVSMSSQFGYRMSLTATVSSITPTSLSAGISGEINFTVTGVTVSDSFDILFQTRVCIFTRMIGNIVSCRLPRGDPQALPQSPITPKFIVRGKGGAIISGGVTLDTAFRVTSISTNMGSFMGGVRLTVTGVGFSGMAKVENVWVECNGPNNSLVQTPCNVESYSTTSLLCHLQTPASQVRQWARDAGTGIAQCTVVTRTNNVTAPCASCGFQYRDDKTGLVNSVARVSGMINRLRILGLRFFSPMMVTILKAGASSVDLECMNPVVTASDTTAECDLPELVPAGTYTVEVHSGGFGYCESSRALNITYTLMISQLQDHANHIIGLPSASPVVGSTGGGHMLHLIGLGFQFIANRNQVKFGTRTATVSWCNGSHLEVFTPIPSTTSSITTVSVTVSILESNLINVIATQTLTNAYKYDPALIYTPILESVTPVVGWMNEVITITAKGLSNVTSQTIVSIGGVVCSMVPGSWISNVGGNVDRSTFQCTVGSTSAGVFPVQVTYVGRGIAKGVINFQSNGEVTAITPTTMGYGGGLVVTVTGRGFPNTVGSIIPHIHSFPTDSSVVSVDFCHSHCSVSFMSYTRIDCTVGEVLNPNILNTRRHRVPFPLSNSLSTGGAITGQNMGGSESLAFDGNPETTAYSSSSPCFIQADFGDHVHALLTRIRYFPMFQQGSTMVGGMFSGSHDGISWMSVANISEITNEGWNYIDIVSDLNTVDFNTAHHHRYFRYTGPAGGVCRIGEIQFIGFFIASDNSGNCPISVSVGSTRLTVLGTVAPLSFSVPATPFITSISPKSGSARGGDLVTIAGGGFPASLTGDVTVALNGVNCIVQSTSSSSLTCITGARTDFRRRSVEVIVAGGGKALAHPTIGYRFLDRWSDPRTWKNGEMPADGDSVSVPMGQSILVDQSSPLLNLVLVEGELVFDRKDMTFDAKYILALGGCIEAGEETDPFLNKLTITLHGDRWKDLELPEVGNKMIAIMNRGGASHDSSASGSSHSMGMGHGSVPDAATNVAMLHIHGRPRRRTWVKLAVDAQAGTNLLTVADDVDFEYGETLIVTSSDVSFDHTEEVTVASRSSNNRTIALQAPLMYRHRAQIFAAGIYGHSDVDMRSEVALLSRNIIIQGDKESDAQLYGVHTVAAHGGIYQIENAEIRRCGQGFNLGRYCTHVHMLGDASQSFVKSNSIHHSFQRAATIHGVRHYQVKHNVAYNVRGHTYFVEDGAEKYNVLEENLAAVTVRCFACLKGDTKPASFWTSSPSQFWRHNVAAGSINDGFWLELPGNPHGPSFTTSICPVHDHLGQFFNNTAHSNGVMGLRIYPQYTPLKIPCDSNSGPAPQYFYNFTSYRNGVHGLFGKKNGDLHHIYPKLVENSGDDQLWVKYEEIEYSNNPNVRGGLYVGTTSGSTTVWDKFGITMPQNEFFFMEDVTFVNYGTLGAGFQGCAECDSPMEMKQGGYTYRIRGARFFNTPNRLKFTSPYKDIHWDLDGSVSGIPGQSWWLTAYKPHNHQTGCVVESQALGNGLRCDAAHPVRKLAVDGVDPRELDWMRMGIIAQPEGLLTDVFFRPKELYGWVTPVVTKHSYDIVWPYTYTTWRTAHVKYSEPSYIDGTNEFVYLRLNWTEYRDHINAYYYAPEGPFEVPRLSNRLPTGSDAIGSNYMVEGNWTEWGVVITTNNATNTDPTYRHRLDIKGFQCPRFGCPVPGDEPLGPPKLWSDPQTWPNGILPTSDMPEVKIPSGKYIMLDINPPKLQKMIIEGRLEFLDGGDRKLEVESIVVWGSLVIGWPDRPFTFKAEVVFNGDRETAKTVVVDDNMYPGAKALVVLGRLIVNGNPVATSWTRIAVTMVLGSKAVSVSQPVSWSVGSQVVITPTEYYTSSQVEVHEIAAVSADKLTLTLKNGSVTDHFVGSISAGTGKSPVQIAAAIGLISRNIKFTGVSATSSGFGAHIIVGPAAEGLRLGWVQLSNAEFNGFGQVNSDKAAIDFAYATSSSFPPGSINPSSSITNCSFLNTNNYGVVSMYGDHLYLANNVFHGGKRSGIDISSGVTNISIINNLITGWDHSPDIVSTMNAAEDPFQWATPIAGIYVNAVPARMFNNLVAGVSDAGYTFIPEACGSSPATIYNNEAHSTLVGVFLLSTASVDCVRLEKFKAYKSAHIGILTVDQIANVRLSEVTVTDSHIGISLNFFRSSASARVWITKSNIFGSTPASSCLASVECRAVAPGDVLGVGSKCRSVYGTSTRRIGLMTSQYTNRGKTCNVDGGLPVCRPPNTPERMCNMPWEQRHGLPNTRNAHMFVSETVFGYFSGAASDCSKDSYAVSVNPTQVNYAPPMTFSKITWLQVATSARYRFSTSIKTNGECATGFCDGLLYVLIRDQDGTAGLMGIAGANIISHNPSLTLPSPQCVSRDDWRGFECKDIQYRGAVFENLDSDRGFRRLGPLVAARVYNNAENRSYAAEGPIDDSCAMRFYFGQIPFAISPGVEHNMRITNTLGGYMRLHYQSFNESESALVNLFVARPNVLEVFVDGILIPMSKPDSPPTLSSPRGSYLHNPQKRNMLITVKGGGDGIHQYDIRRRPEVQVTMTLSMSVEEFYGKNVVTNLATFLQIDVSRIKVVDVQSGSVVTNLLFLPFNSSNMTVTIHERQVDELNDVADLLEGHYRNGTLSSRFGVTSMNVVSRPFLSVSDEPSPPTILFGLTTGEIAAICAGVTVFAGIVLFFVLKKYYWKKSGSGKGKAAGSGGKKKMDKEGVKRDGVVLSGAKEPDAADVVAVGTVAAVVKRLDSDSPTGEGDVAIDVGDEDASAVKIKKPVGVVKVRGIGSILGRKGDAADADGGSKKARLSATGSMYRGQYGVLDVSTPVGANPSYAHSKPALVVGSKTVHAPVRIRRGKEGKDGDSTHV